MDKEVDNKTNPATIDHRIRQQDSTEPSFTGRGNYAKPYNLPLLSYARPELYKRRRVASLAER